MQADSVGTSAPYAALAGLTRPFGQALVAELGPGDVLRLVGCLLACQPLAAPAPAACALGAMLALATAAVATAAIAELGAGRGLGGSGGGEA